MYIGIEITIDEQGRVVIPKSYREFFGFLPKRKLFAFGTENGVLITEKNYMATEDNDTSSI